MTNNQASGQIYIIKIMAKQSQIFYKRAHLCVYTAVNRAVFSDNFPNCCNNAESDFYSNKIIVLKKIKSLRQLRRTEKELVWLNGSVHLRNKFSSI